MPRLSIENLGSPPEPFRVDIRARDLARTVKFEKTEQCIDDDAKRVQLLTKAAASGVLKRKERQGAKQLVRFLAECPESRPLSAASRVAMCEWRVRVTGWLWALVDPIGPSEWRAFTLVLPSWWVKSRDLKHVDAKQLMSRLRAALHRAGSGKASGWLYAMVHGEYDGGTGGFSVHVHGLVTEGMVQVLRDLRKQPQFCRNKIDPTRYPMINVRRKLLIQCPERDYPSLISYTSKSYWPQHDSCIEADGVRRRVGKKHMIEGKHLARCLIWLHANRVKDQVLLVHLSVVDGKLVAGKRGDPKPE